MPTAPPSLSLTPSLEASIDTHAFEAACAAGELDQALQLYGGDFLDGLSLEGCSAFEEWAFFRREALRSRLVQALERLIERDLARGEPRAAIHAATRLVSLDPLSETAQRHLISAYLRAGDRAAAERQYQSCARLLKTELGVAPDAQTQALLAVPSAAAPALGPRTRYAERSGMHLAYQVAGSGPIDIVVVPGFVSHVERIWEEPRSRAMLLALSQMGRLVLFDRRGVGLSDRVGAPPTIEATAEDLATVMDAAGCKTVVLIGASEGGPSCIHFAAKHPQRLAGGKRDDGANGQRGERFQHRPLVFNSQRQGTSVPCRALSRYPTGISPADRVLHTPQLWSSSALGSRPGTLLACVLTFLCHPLAVE